MNAHLYTTLSFTMVVFCRLAFWFCFALSNGLTGKHWTVVLKNTTLWQDAIPIMNITRSTKSRWLCLKGTISLPASWVLFCHLGWSALWLSSEFLLSPNNCVVCCNFSKYPGEWLISRIISKMHKKLINMKHDTYATFSLVSLCLSFDTWFDRSIYVHWC